MDVSDSESVDEVGQVDSESDPEWLSDAAVSDPGSSDSDSEDDEIIPQQGLAAAIPLQGPVGAPAQQGLAAVIPQQGPAGAPAQQGLAAAIPQQGPPNWNWSKDQNKRQTVVPHFSPHRAPGNYLPHGVSPKDLDFATIFFHHFDKANDIIMTETNRRGAVATNKKGVKIKWEPVDLVEMLKFWAVIIAMGLMNRPTLKAYWAKDWLYAPAFAKIMSRDRFLCIFRMLRYCDLEAAIRDGRGNPNSPAYDPLFLVRDLLNAVLERCGALRQPGNRLVIDEQLCLFTGKFKWKQVTQLFWFYCFQ